MSKNREFCSRLCIDDLCRGNPDNTLCGGSYCYECQGPKVDDGSLCDKCREKFYDAEENDDDEVSN